MQNHEKRFEAENTKFHSRTWSYNINKKDCYLNQGDRIRLQRNIGSILALIALGSHEREPQFVFTLTVLYYSRGLCVLYHLLLPSLYSDQLVAVAVTIVDNIYIYINNYYIPHWFSQ